MAKKIEVYVEKSPNGEYWGTTQNIVGVVSSVGNSLENLERNLTEAMNDHIEIAEELGEDYIQEYKDFSFEFKLDLQSFFDLIPEIKISNLADKADINPSLLRQYKTGKANASIGQLKKIEKAVHQLGNELLSVSF
ncbi:type II toxin-antitoxin system HicB family antitoxin [Ornithobacterium rhinotracheale]|uniref:type II toxin-antitoxin system HicB family antitoxin n=1 Tax=Ornithobacterium rhinotracheale TaxID=28251 RepID=UPI0039A66B18